MLLALADYINDPAANAVIQEKNPGIYQAIEDITGCILFILRDLCIDNPVAQSQLFKELGSFHCDKMYKICPLNFIMAIESVLANNPMILHTNRKGFWMLYNTYKEKLEKFLERNENFLDPASVDKMEILTLWCFNKIFHNMMKYGSIPKEKIQPYDTIMAILLSSPVCTKILTCLKNPDFLPKANGLYKFQINLYKADTPKILALQKDNTNITDDIKKCMIVELFVSFLK